MSKIVTVHARQLLDCKARPMVEVVVTTEDGVVGRGAAPTGQSVGMHEAVVLRDGDPGAYSGLSVRQAVANVEETIGPALVGMDIREQRTLDQRMIELDGTPDKHRLGGNAIYSTSIACLRGAAELADQPLYRYLSRSPIRQVPVPCFNVINGGRDGDIVQPFNEFIVVPWGAKSIDQAVEMGVLFFAALGARLQRHLGRPPEVGSSYGYRAPSADPAVVLELMQATIRECGYADAMALALDCASSEMYDANTCTYELLGRRVVNAELVTYARQLSEQFDLVFVEDLLDENDWDGWAEAPQQIPRSLLLGDDLIATNRERLERAVALRAVDGFILKPNQVGTISEALDTFAYAQDCGLLAIPSGRSGGVIDDVVMDLSVGLEVPFQKTGAPRAGERIEKLNFLMRVADTEPGSRLSDLTKLIRFR